MTSRRDVKLKSYYIRENRILERVSEDDYDPQEEDEREDFEQESNFIASEIIEYPDKSCDTSVSTKLLTGIQNEIEAFSILDENKEVYKTRNPRFSEIGTYSNTNGTAACFEEYQGSQLSASKPLSSTLESISKETRFKNANFDSTREDMNANIDELRREIQILKKEVASSKQCFRTVEAKYKDALTNALKEKRISEAIYTQETERLLRKVESLQHQRNDLINAFKNQTKLLDNLKRQKCHTEALNIFSIVGEEFIKFTNQ